MTTTATAGKSPAKEVTILGLSQDIHKRLEDFQARLDNHFARSIKAEGEGKDRPVIPNVLDEIIEELEVNKLHLSQIISFVSSEVLPKIN